jgi:hypothetical protein
MGNVHIPSAKAFDDKWGARWRGESDQAHLERSFAAFFLCFR